MFFYHFLPFGALRSRQKSNFTGHGFAASAVELDLTCSSDGHLYGFVFPLSLEMSFTHCIAMDNHMNSIRLRPLPLRQTKHSFDILEGREPEASVPGSVSRFSCNSNNNISIVLLSNPFL